MKKRCTLIVKDQCNIKFEGLDPLLRKRLVNFLKYPDPNARFSNAFKLKRWDGKIAFMSLGGGTFLNMLPLILPLIEGEGYEIDLEDHRPQLDWEFPEIDEEYMADRTWPDGHVLAGDPIMLREHQVRAVNAYLQNWQSTGKIATGAGKAQPLRSKIKIPGGWTTMGEIKIGDLVSTPDGGSAKVSGLYPQGKKKIYKITFKDGRAAEACGEHLWNVRCMDFKKKHEKESHVRTLTTDQIAYRLANTKRPMRIQLPRPEIIDDIELPIDPYVIGALLGDGGLKHQSVIISSADREILVNISKRLIDGYELRHQSRYDYSLVMTPEHFSNECKRLNWKNSSKNRKIPTESANVYKKTIDFLKLNVKSNEKFVPEIYLEASEKQKIQLVQGLLDTNGYVGKNGEISFTSVSKKLADDMIYLIRSIGGTASLYSRFTKYTHNGELRQGQLAYTVRIRHRNPKNLLSLSRKLTRISNDYQYKNSLASQIVSIEYAGDYEAQCMMIDHPEHLYITDDYIVTHNTIITAVLSRLVEESTQGRSIVIVPSKSLVVQTEADYKNVGLNVGVFFGDRKELNRQHTICTWQSLAVLNKKGSKRKKVKGKWETSATFDEDFDMESFLKNVNCVIVDECHGAKSKELKELLCGPMANIPLRWGMTGTVPKQDFQFAAVLAGIGDVVIEVTSDELIKKGILSECKIHAIQLQMQKRIGYFIDWDDEKKFTNTNREIMEWLATFTEEITKTSGSTLLFVENIETGKILEKLIPESVFVHGSIDVDDRKTEYKRIDNTKNQILIATYGVAAVGISMTFLFNVILFNSGKSGIKILQSIGRGLRKGESELVDMIKNAVDVYDVCTDFKFAKRHLSQRKSYYKEEKFPFTVTKVEI